MSYFLLRIVPHQGSIHSHETTDIFFFCILKYLYLYLTLYYGGILLEDGVALKLVRLVKAYYETLKDKKTKLSWPVVINSRNLITQTIVHSLLNWPLKSQTCCKDWQTAQVWQVQQSVSPKASNCLEVEVRQLCFIYAFFFFLYFSRAFVSFLLSHWWLRKNLLFYLSSGLLWHGE